MVEEGTPLSRMYGPNSASPIVSHPGEGLGEAV